jgi:transcriptional regulator with XRE-family HTH domain
MSREKLRGLTLGELVREVRENKGLSVTEMAFHLGMSEAAVRHYEAGVRQPKPHFLKSLAEIAPPEVREEIENRLPDRLRGLMTYKATGRRCSEKTVVDAHTALDTIFDKAPSPVIDAVVRYLIKRAVEYRELSDQFPAALEKKKMRRVP